MEENQLPKESVKPGFNKEEVTGFFKDNLPQILKTYFFWPVTGTYNLFKNADNKSYQHSVILIIATALLCIIVPYIFAGDARDYMDFSDFLKVGFGTAIFQIIISGVSFAVKSISGKPNFRRELLTGALSGIPLILFLVIVILAKLFIGDVDMMGMMAFSNMLDNLKFLLLLGMFVPLLLINTLLQSFLASDMKETLSWYAAPLALVLSVYLTMVVLDIIF